ncbi:hypothetical protein KCU85_g4682, partial [Aureobasidium melanogenum]
MNSTDTRQAELKKIKDAVRQNNKRKRATPRAQSEERSGRQARLSDVDNASTENHVAQYNWADAPPEISEPPLGLSGEDMQPHSLEQASSRPSSIAPSPSATTYFRFGFHREAELLMHYLDHVFALQFRFYSPSIQSGGRGWLLWLLTETKPLYHAALSLGALHQHSLLARSARGKHYLDTLNELNEHHNRALQELQIFLQSSYEVSAAGRKRRLQILACGVQFISFELFRGGTSQWQVHLDALATVVRGMPFMNSTDTGPSPGNLTPVTPSELEPHRLEDNAEHFLVGAVLWFDILSCASTSDAPRLHSEAVGLLQGQIDLANIIPCQSWVALAMNDIAALGAWKIDAVSACSLSFWKLFEKADPIRKRLGDGIAGLRTEIDESLAALGISHFGMGAYLILTNPGVQQEAIKRTITLVFAYAAQVYLNTIISGADPKLDDVRNSVIDTMNALQELQLICDAQALRNLIWPICIAGSMAEDVPTQTYFQSLIEDLGEEAHAFGNTRTTLHIMQKCWTSRDENRTGSWDWATAMESLGQRVLLV